jgi:hypothetical protein
MNNETRSPAHGGTRPSQSAQTLGGSVGTAVDSAINTMEGAVDRGKAMAFGRWSSRQRHGRVCNAANENLRV